jgi:spore coat polysaccharide biosynthesis protein SpsF
MTETGPFRTPQEEFWAGEFGTSYISRNVGEQILASNLNFFSTTLRQAGTIRSCLELGANVGMNLRALRLLYPDAALKAVEINPDAARILSEWLGPQNVFTGSLFDYPATETFDLVLLKGVLIHINPEMLPVVYDTIFRASQRLVLIAEYYNPSPVAVAYRGHSERLFKRDFAGELLDREARLRLIDYGFAYHRAAAFPQDDISWFLLERGA